MANDLLFKKSGGGGGGGSTVASVITSVTSSSCGLGFSTSSTSFVDVTNLSVSLTTTGGRVFLALIADGTTDVGAFGVFRSGATSDMNAQFLEGSTGLGIQHITTNSTGEIDIPPSAVAHSYVPAAGTYTYKLQVKVTNASAIGFVQACKLVAWTLTDGTSPTVQYSWTGYHDRVVSNWNFTSTGSFADPASNSANGNDVVQVDNNNFGTVTQYASGSRRLPGITFTPPRLGRYQITATAVYVSGPAGANALTLRLTDGTTVISEGGALSSASDGTVTLHGILNITSLSAKTLRLQGQVTAGTGVITEPGYGQGMLFWSINTI